MDLQPVSKCLPKSNMAVLAGPTRSFMGWAIVRTGKLSRSIRRYLILRSSHLTICATENPRSEIMAIGVNGASLTSTSNRFECLIRSENIKIWIQWASETEFRICRSAFEFSNRRVEDYYKLVTHRQLGKGRSAEVIFAFDTSSGDHAAVKVMNKDKARSSDREFAEKEVLIRMTIQHPCIVQTLDIFESPYDLFVVMEYMGGGPLDRRMSKQNFPLTEAEARIVMTRLFLALSHLHSRDIVHRNVKPANIFLDVAEGVRWPETAKLSDFSLASFLSDPDCSRQVVGTPEYLAPEASIMAKTQDGERAVTVGTEVDMWAAGVTLYNMLSLELPFDGEYPTDIFKKARRGKLVFPKKSFKHVSPEAISLIKSLLNVDRRKRPTADTVMLHNWFQIGRKRAQRNNDELLEEALALSLSNKLNGLSEGLYRFRIAVLAVRIINCFAYRTPGVQLKPMGKLKVEKRFQFGVSGVDIAPVKPDFDGAGEALGFHTQTRSSSILLSRLSAGSTVKSRSSVGGDSVVSTPPNLPKPPPVDAHPLPMKRSDTNYDYFSRTGPQADRHGSFESSSVLGGPLLKSWSSGYGSLGSNPTYLSASEQARGNWPWRRR